jgi:hypothetical protein
MSTLVDKKVNVIFDKYRDNHYAYTASEDVEAIRKRAVNTGAAITTIAFISNEFVRMSFRSRKFPILICIISYLQADCPKCALLALRAHPGDQVPGRISN